MAYTLGVFASFYRYFQVENLESNAYVDGQFLNGDPDANYLNSASPASGPGSLPVGTLLKGNVVYMDPASANGANPNVKRMYAATATGLPSRALWGLVFGSNNMAYTPLTDGIPPGRPVSVIRGTFDALLDANSFAAGAAPTALGQLVYADVTGTAVNRGLLSTVQSGTVATPDMPLGEVVGFESVTKEGSTGPQVSSVYAAGPPRGTPVVLNGGTVVRVRFRVPSVGDK
jgi:hypothetical protein